jgi:hypothetical protein
MTTAGVTLVAEVHLVETHTLSLAREYDEGTRCACLSVIYRRMDQTNSGGRVTAQKDCLKNHLDITSSLYTNEWCSRSEMNLSLFWGLSCTSLTIISYLLCLL